MGQLVGTARPPGGPGAGALGAASPPGGPGAGAVGAARPSGRNAAAVSAVGLLVSGLLAAGCTSHNAFADSGGVPAVGAENEYANVISQIGGRYVHAVAIMSNPNTDPHTFEASPQVAQEVSAAQLVVQNGLGYDTFMHNIEAAAPSTARKVIDVQRLLGLPNNTPNPHLWYAPRTLPVVARAIAKALAALAPAHARYFAANLARFDASLRPWARAIARVRSRFRNDPVATTEPVADYLLQAAGLDNRTPFSFQADVMNGVDPSPQNLSLEQNLFNRHLVRAFLYNRQVTDSLTRTMVALARSDGIPVVGVYETMPTPGYDYQSWMLAVTTAIQRALAGGP